MIHAEGLTKRYGETVALGGIDLDVPAGSILGMLGPNGAGKTTAVRILTTLALPNEGSRHGRRLRRRAPSGAGASKHRRHRPRRDGRRTAHRPTEPHHDRTPQRTLTRRRQAPRRRAARATSIWPTRVAGSSRATPAACAVASTSPRASSPSHPSCSSMNRRRARPHQSGAHVGHHPSARGERGHACSSPRSTSTRPTSWPTRSSWSTTAASSPTERPPISKRRSAAHDSRSRCPNPTNGPRLALRPLTDGDVHVSHDGRRLRAPVRSGTGLATAVVRTLDQAGITVDDVEVHQPSLDDVFFALTGHATIRT